MEGCTQALINTHQNNQEIRTSLLILKGTYEHTKMMVTGSHKQQTIHSGIFNWAATVLGFGGCFTIQGEASK